MGKYNRLQKELDDIEMEQAELTEKQKKLEARLHKLKNGDHTEESWENLQDAKTEIQDIQVRKAELKTRQKEVRQEIHALKSDDPQEEISNLIDENADLKEEISSLRDEVKRLRDIRSAAKDLVSKVQGVGLPRVARDVDEDKNIYSSTAASLWTGDIVEVVDKHNSLRELL